MLDAAVALDGRGSDLNAVFGNLELFAEEANRAVGVLDSERVALEGFVRDGGAVFDALSESGRLGSLITNADTVFATTAARDAELEAAFRALPTFLDEARETLTRLDTFAADTNPLVTQLRLPPLLTRLDPFLDQLNPPLIATRAYRREITAFLANTAAATTGFNLSSEAGGEATRYLRTVAPLNPEALAGFPSRLKSNRTIPYVQPGGFTELSQGLESFSTSQCSSGANATIDPADAGAFPEGFFDRLQEFAFAGELSSDDIPAARCDKQDRFESLGGSFTEFTDYLHIRADP